MQMAIKENNNEFEDNNKLVIHRIYGNDAKKVLEQLESGCIAFEFSVIEDELGNPIVELIKSTK